MILAGVLLLLILLISDALISNQCGPCDEVVCTDSQNQEASLWRDTDRFLHYTVVFEQAEE